MSGFDLNSMFSEETLKNKTKNVQVLEVNLSDIENNVANFYPIESLENSNEFQGLKTSISQDGLLSPILVSKTAEGDYRVISGHRRLEAHRQLGLSTIACIVDTVTFDDDDEEQIRIISANIQREKTPEIIENEVAKLSVIFDDYKLRGLIAEGILKRDWIGLKIGRSGRTVQKYLPSVKDLRESEKQPTLLEEEPKAIKTFANKELAKLSKFNKAILKLNEGLQIQNLSSEDSAKFKDILNMLDSNIQSVINQFFE